jgi:hypothetical protein
VQPPNGPVATHTFEVDDGKFAVLLSGASPPRQRRLYGWGLTGATPYAELKQAKAIMDAAV